MLATGREGVNETTLFHVEQWEATKHQSGSCPRIASAAGEPVALGMGPVAEQPRRAAPFGVEAPRTRL